MKQQFVRITPNPKHDGELWWDYMEFIEVVLRDLSTQGGDGVIVDDYSAEFLKKIFSLFPGWSDGSDTQAPVIFQEGEDIYSPGLPTMAEVTRA